MVTSAMTIGSSTRTGAADPSTFHGLTPARLLDTRSPFVTVDGEFGGLGRIAPGGSIDLVVAGRGGVPPAGADAVALNVTAVDPLGPGFVTVFPAADARPNASNLNYVARQTVPNMVIAAIGAGGAVTLFSSHHAHLVVDVLGWFPTGGGFTAIAPARLVDSRDGYPTFDMLGRGGGFIAPRNEREFRLLGRGGMPDVKGAVAAVALNVTSTENVMPGYFTVHPHNAPRAVTSNLNFAGGQTVPNMAIVPLPPGGGLDVYNGSDGRSHVIVDLLGWFPVSPSFTPLRPARLMDTRAGESTVDEQFLGTGAVGPGEARRLKVTGRADVPTADVGAVVLNVTVTNPTASGYVTVFPKGADQPTASNLNFAAGQTIANMVIVPVGDDGEISLFNFAGASDIVVDVMGWFPVP